jgi:hypothetical protein
VGFRKLVLLVLRDISDEVDTFDRRSGWLYRAVITYSPVTLFDQEKTNVN